MKSKTIDIPIYNCDLTIIFTKDLNTVVKKYKLEGNWGEFGALTFEDKSKFRSYVVAFTDANHLSNIAHEIVHIKNYIFLGINAKVDLHNDEPEAYLTGWLFDQINNFLKPFKTK
jgi:hypothetical protein